MYDPDAITVAILAGGQGRRMGVPKDRLTIGGRPILLHLLDRLDHRGPTLLVASPQRPRPLGCDAFPQITLDAVQDAGPLAGLAAALAASATPIIAVLSLDMPNVSHLQLRWLVDRLNEARTAIPDTQAIMLRRPIAGRLLIEPFPAVYHQSAKPHIERRLAVLAGSGTADASLRGLVSESGFCSADAPADWDSELWLNLNSPEDLLHIGAQIA